MKQLILVSLLILGLNALANEDVALDQDQSFDLTILTHENDLMDHLREDPPQPPYGYIYGPGRTVRWYDYGSSRVPKILSQTLEINIDDRLVNEIILRASGNRVNVRSVVATLVDGTRIDLWNLTGTIRANRQLRARLDRYYSLRVTRLEIQATTSNLIGSRANIQVFLGLAEW